MAALAGASQQATFLSAVHYSSAGGESCTGFFLVALGKIRIFKLSPAGREQVLLWKGADLRAWRAPWSSRLLLSIVVTNNPFRHTARLFCPPALQHH
jgi:hypothetical protein